MCDLTYNHIDSVGCVRSLSSNSSLFVLKGDGKYLLFIHGGNITTFFVFIVNKNEFTLKSRIEIESPNCIRKITGNDDCILMLDIEDQLYYLGIAEGDSCRIFHSSIGCDILNKSQIFWVKINTSFNCVDVIGVKEGVAFIYQDMALYIGYNNIIGLKNELEFTSKRLNDFIEGRCYLYKLKGHMAQTITSKLFQIAIDEVVLIMESSQITFWMSTSQGQILSQSYSANFNGDYIINVVYFKKKNLVFIICRSGKVVSLKFDIPERNFELRQLWLDEKISAALVFEDNDYLLWSDLNHLYVSRLTNDCKIVNIKVIHDLRGIKLLTSFHKSILGVTVCGCIYEINVSEVYDEDVRKSSHSLLNRIYESGKVIEDLRKNVKEKEQMIEALEISKDSSILKDIYVLVKKDLIIIENKTRYTFFEKFWSIQIESKNLERNIVEVKELESDLPSGGSIMFVWNNKHIQRIALTFNSMTCTCFIELKVKNESNLPDPGEGLDELNQFLKDNYS